MSTKENIQRLLDLFMEGKTTVEEESALAEYFRGDTVPEEWEAYKEMFNYFDEGMPEGRFDSEPTIKPARLRLLWPALAVAAAAVLALVMAWWRNDAGTIEPQAQPQTLAVVTDTALENRADTVLLGEKAAQPARSKRKTSKYKYRIAPPKTHYAKTETAPATTANDSLSRDEQLIAAQLKGAEIAEQLLLRKIELMEQTNELEAILASNEDVFDEEEAETAY